VTQITNEELYETAFYYVVGVISGMEYYEDIPEVELVYGFLQRAEDIILERKRIYEED
jgi:hypothetical protein